MKQYIYSLLIVVFGTTNLEAQKLSDNFGIINIDELKMQKFNADATAEAVIIYDIGNTYFSPSDQGFRIIFERTTKIKILSKAGIDYATVEIPFYVDREGMERVENIQGFTYNLVNGAPRIAKFDPLKVYEEKQSEHWFVKKFALPDVSEGSVIEYKYTIDSPYLFNFRDWVYQHRIPTIYSEYTARMVPFYEYVYILQGANKFDVYSVVQDHMSQQFGPVKYVDNIYTYGMKNIPAFRDEDYITSINDYILKLDFQLSVVHSVDGSTRQIMGKWPELNQEMLKSSEFGGFIKSFSKNANEVLAPLKLSGLDQKAKMEAIYHYVNSNFAWDGIKDKFANKTAKELLSKKIGNCASLNLALLALLNSAGMEAYPVLLSTRDHGKVQVKYPFQQFLNYVIVLVKSEGENILLDATEPLSPLGLLPARCINEKGIIVDKDKEEWIELKNEHISDIGDSLQIQVSRDCDSVYIHQHIESTGQEALRLRIANSEGGSKLGKAFLPSDHVLTDSVVTGGQEDTQAPFEITLSSKGTLESVGGKVLVYPFRGLVFAENPLKIPYRAYPVDMIYPWSKHFHVKLTIPDGYTVNEPPKEVSISNKLVDVNYRVVIQNKDVLIEGYYTFKKAVYLNFEYFDIKDYFNRIVTAFNSPIVLVKL